MGEQRGVQTVATRPRLGARFCQLACGHGHVQRIMQGGVHTKGQQLGLNPAATQPAIPSPSCRKKCVPHRSSVRAGCPSQAARGEFGEDEKKGQKEINLKEDVPAEARALLYRDYLMSTMSGG